MGAGASVSEGFDRAAYDHDVVVAELVKYKLEDPSKYKDMMDEVREKSRSSKPAFGLGMVVADVARVPEEEAAAFKDKHVSTAYLHDDTPEQKERFRNATKIQYTRWEWAVKNTTSYVNVLRAAGHSDENIQGIFDGRPLCWPDDGQWAEFKAALGELKAKVEAETGWDHVQFVHAGSAVPGFSQNPCKGHRDLPSKITDPSKSDVDICIVGDGVLDSFLKLEKEGEVKVRRYPSTTGRMSKGMRFSVKGFSVLGECIEEFHKAWSEKLAGGLQFTFAEDDQGIPGWEIFIPTE